MTGSAGSCSDSLTPVSAPGAVKGRRNRRRDDDNEDNEGDDFGRGADDNFNADSHDVSQGHHY